MLIDIETYTTKAPIIRVLSLGLIISLMANGTNLILNLNNFKRSIF